MRRQRIERAAFGALVICLLLVTYHNYLNRLRRTAARRFVVAVLKGDGREIQSLLSAGLIPLNARGHLTRTLGGDALLLSVIGDHSEVVRLLLHQGVDVNTCDVNGRSTLWTALTNAHTDCARLLLERGADVHHDDHNVSGTPLMFAADTPGVLSARYAADTAALDIVRMLLRKGADVNATSQDGATALHWAAIQGHTEIIRELLTHGARVDAVDRHGQTPLSLAAARGYGGVVKLLLAYGADTARIQSAPDLLSR